MLIVIISICTGILWQSITLTTIGNIIVGSLDIILHNITLLVKGGKKR